MVTHGRAVVRFLDKAYPSNDKEAPTESYRLITEATQETNVAAEAEEKRKENSLGGNAFHYSTPPAPPIDPTTNILFRVKKADLDKIRIRLKKRNASAKSIGEYTFNYFLKRECE